MANKLTDAQSILDAKTHVAYTKFIKDGKLPITHKTDREEMRLILKTMCKHIANGMVETPGGVYIKKIGYFFNWMSPRKMSYHLKIKGGKLKELFNYHSDHYMYFPTFIPMSPRLHMRSNFTMDKQFNHLIKIGVSKKIKEGFKYKNYMHSIKSI